MEEYAKIPPSVDQIEVCRCMQSGSYPLLIPSLDSVATPLVPGLSVFHSLDYPQTCYNR